MTRWILLSFALVFTACQTTGAEKQNVASLLSLPQGWSAEGTGIGTAEHSCRSDVKNCVAITMATFRDPLTQGDRGAIYKLCTADEKNLSAQEFSYRLEKEMMFEKGSNILADEVRNINSDRRGRVVVYEPFAGYRRYVWYEYHEGEAWKVFLQDVESSDDGLQKPFERLVRSMNFDVFDKQLSKNKCKPFGLVQ